MTKYKNLFPVTNERKIVIGIIGHIIFVPFLLRLFMSSPKLTNLEAVFTTTIVLIGSILLSAMDYLPYEKDAKVWLVDQSLGTLLLKSAGILALWALMLSFK